MAHSLQVLLNSAELSVLYQPEALVYLLVVLTLLASGVLSFAQLMRIKLATELAAVDNKALAVTLTGFTVGVAAILYGVLTSGGYSSLVHDLVDLALSGVVGIALLHLGRLVLDRVALRSFSTRDEILGGNLGVAFTEAGNALGTALIVMRSLSLAGLTEGERLLHAGLFFVAAQSAFTFFALVYRRVARFDVVDALTHGNAAAGISLGATLLAQGLLLSYAISQTASLVVFFGWFVLSTALLLLLRRAVDFVLLRGHDLDHELSVDRNWGVALVEGGVALSVALLLTGAF